MYMHMYMHCTVMCTVVYTYEPHVYAVFVAV